MTLPLTATQMILELEAIIEEHGDLPVRIRMSQLRIENVLEPEVVQDGFEGDPYIEIKAAP